MGFFTDKVLLPLFMVGIRTKRIAKSVVRGKLNYRVRKIIPYAVGTMIVIWALFVFSL